ncbi:hypothetical protein N0V83_005189 [Neocucurbitaria cava]|uniref:Uncharacterized protein n=1 Tax=Neocucurbitaria cava TaxID=798079 RepID=A0A9W8Y8H5_9PLEO|nr:hypothetical protein N0V83_005189 [Neocucurbitaria cava]
MFHLHMYAMAEDLEYDALMSTAHRHIYERATGGKLLPAEVRDLVDAAFSPIGSDARICKDGQGYIQDLVAVVAIVQGGKRWNDAAHVRFARLLKGEEYTGFWDKYNALKELNEDLLGSASTRPNRRERQRQDKVDVLAKKPDGGKVKKSQRFRKGADGKLIDRNKAEFVARMVEDM